MTLRSFVAALKALPTVRAVEQSDFYLRVFFRDRNKGLPKAIVIFHDLPVTEHDYVVTLEVISNIDGYDLDDEYSYILGSTMSRVESEPALSDGASNFLSRLDTFTEENILSSLKKRKLPKDVYR